MPLRTLAHRHLQPELMDDPEIEPATHLEALRGLARLNRASRIVHTVETEIRRAVGDGPISVLDVAAGSGDLVTALASRAARTGRDWTFGACDISQTACDTIAGRSAAAGVDIPVHRIDAIRQPLPDGYDIVMCHLFLHHLTEPDAQRVLARMHDSAARAVFVTDLRRSKTGYLLALAASRVFTRSFVVHTDALRSVEGAFSLDELAACAQHAGIPNARIRRAWPERMVLWCDT